MKISLIGFGRMGKEIRKLALEHGHEVVSTIDPAVKSARYREISRESLEGAEVAIEFTAPEFAFENIEKLASLEIDTVVGTTGWSEKIAKVKKTVEESGIGFIYAPNFSLGVNLFYEIVKHASRIFDKVEEYDVFCHEWHHKDKLDSPSGTAGKISQIVVSEIKRKKAPVFQCLNRKREDSELHVSSTRGGWVPGTHEVVFDSEFDSIELIHRTRNRKGLALGALKAAEWVRGRKGFFEFSDYLKDALGI